MVLAGVQTPETGEQVKRLLGLFPGLPLTVEIADQVVLFRKRASCSLMPHKRRSPQCIG